MTTKPVLGFLSHDVAHRSGDETRGEVPDSIAVEQREGLFALLRMMKTNLVQACRATVPDKEIIHG